MAFPTRTISLRSTAGLPPPGGSARPYGLFAGVLIVLVLLLGAWASWLIRPQHPAAIAPVGAGPVAAGPQVSAEPSASAAPEVQRPLTGAPTGVSWELFEGVALPVSATDGPTRIRGPVHAGFSRTPTGALLADAQITYRRVATPSIPDLRQVAEQQLVDGPGKVAYLNLIASLRDNNPPAAGYTQIAGFRFFVYTPDLAVISIATRDNGKFQMGTDTLRWVDGDWKIDLPADGLQHPQVVANLAGSVPWQGVS